MTLFANARGWGQRARIAATLIPLGLACWMNDASANCFSGLPAEVEVLPENGAVVPSDIENLYVYHGYTDATVSVVAEGETYPIVDRLARLPSDLKPGDEFEYEVIAELDTSATGESDESTKVFGPWSFTVGDAPAQHVVAPSGSLYFLEGTFCGERSTSAASCALEAQRHVVNDCHDTGVAWFFGVDVDSQDEAPLFRVSANGIATFDSRGCTRVMGVPHVGEDEGIAGCSNTSCVNVTPLDRAMRVRSDLSTTICASAHTTDANGSAESAETGCSFTARRALKDSQHDALWLGLIALGATSRRRRVFRRASQPDHRGPA